MVNVITILTREHEKIDTYYPSNETSLSKAHDIFKKICYIYNFIVRRQTTYIDFVSV